ncbi:MAG TPA: serine hydrolase domain-containing protein [Steroidobacteraceae bacterium]|nr:serine hydrolase domain-containing protein [Steroidobacteraceae bacterium]
MKARMLPVLAALTVLGIGAAHAADLEDAGTLEPFIDGVVNEKMALQSIPAAAVGIVYNGRVVFAKGYGYADRDAHTPIDPQRSVLLLGSIAKLFVWTAVMQLAEQHRLDLDADVNRYLKGFAIPATWSQPITLRHLMTHTAGFEEGGPRYVTLATLVGAESVRDALARHIPRRVHPPGEVSSYSNYGAELAGYIVEQVSGQRFAEYVRQHIFAPLDMEHSTMEERLPDALARFRIKAYEKENGLLVAANDDIVGGLRLPGSATGTIVGMAHFMLAHLQNGEYAGVRILSDRSVELMHRVAFQGDPRLPGMTLGFYEQRVNGLRIIAHDGDTLHFHNLLYLVPEKGFGLFASFIGNNGHDAREALVRAVFDRYFPVAPVSTAAGLAADRGDGAAARKDLTRYVGVYQGVRRYHSTVLKALAPARTASVAALANGNLLVTEPNEPPRQFEPVGKDLFQEAQGGARRLAFRPGPDERPAYLYFADQPFMPMEPMPWLQRPSFWLEGTALSGIVFAGAVLLLGRRFWMRRLPSSRRRVALVTACTAMWFFLAAFSMWAVVGANGRALFFSGSVALKLVLCMPLIFVALTVLLLLVTSSSWRAAAWTPWQRAGHLLVVFAASFVSAGVVYWNLLGWQWG